MNPVETVELELQVKIDPESIKRAIVQALRELADELESNPFTLPSESDASR